MIGSFHSWPWRCLAYLHFSRIPTLHDRPRFERDSLQRAWKSLPWSGRYLLEGHGGRPGSGGGWRGWSPSSSLLLVGATPSYATLGGLIWLAVVVTLGARSSSAALIAGLTFTVVPGIFLQYLSPSLSQVPTALFGIGAVLVARNPDGLVAMHGRQLRHLFARQGPSFESRYCVSTSCLSKSGASR